VQAKWLLIMKLHRELTDNTNIASLPIYTAVTNVKAFMKVTRRIKNDNRCYIGIF